MTFSKLLFILSVLLVISNAGFFSKIKQGVNLGLEKFIGNDEKFRKVLPADALDTFPQFCSRLDYPVEIHKYSTSDGYVNTLFRIQAKGKDIRSGLPPVYLQHGFADSADAFIINEETKAPAFVLANHGYDVWLGNTRGNPYSRVNDGPLLGKSEYWDFTVQDMGLYDTPKAFEYIYKITQKKISYIGHSQGATMGLFTLSAGDQKFLKYLDKCILLAPVTYMDTNPFLVRTGAASRFGYLLPKVGKKFAELPRPVQNAFALKCHNFPIVCMKIIEQAFDADATQDNVDRMGIYFAHWPAGTSSRTFEWWNQQLLGNSFRWFDYGTHGNLEHYQQAKAPKVDLSKVTIPIYLFGGKNDLMAPPDALQRLIKDLKNAKVDFRTYNLGHLSFSWGEDTWQYLKDVIEILQKTD